VYIAFLDKHILIGIGQAIFKKTGMCYFDLFFFNLHVGGGSPSWVPSARRPMNGLLYLPRVIMMMEKLVE
jgi:hypothetical protein